ncbi:MAG: DNA-protecting protein DprA [Elusimicrobia bacterium]|nr:DNA-protecting protein DprA [Elusimicrobiota bacterium]
MTMPSCKISVDSRERQARFLLHQCGLRSACLRRLLAVFGAAQEALAGFQISLAKRLKLSEADARALLRLAGDHKKQDHLQSLYEQAVKQGKKFLLEEEFRGSLTGLAEEDLPFALWTDGSIGLETLKQPAIAVVGTRRAGSYGLAVAEKLGSYLAKAGAAVVSGLAYGIDAAAHRAALTAQGTTIAVIGAGLDVFYPPAHRRLQENDIPANGLVISEFPLTSPPLAHHFPQRNRLIAAISSAVVVIEGDLTSGALITARLAASAGKDVYAVPGSIFSPLSRGPNMLLREGAVPLTALDDLAEALPDLKRPAAGYRAVQKSFPKGNYDGGEDNPAYQKILTELSGEAVGLDALLEKTGLGLEAANQALLELEIQGRLRQGPLGYIHT